MAIVAIVPSVMILAGERLHSCFTFHGHTAGTVFPTQGRGNGGKWGGSRLLVMDNIGFKTFKRMKRRFDTSLACLFQSPAETSASV